MVLNGFSGTFMSQGGVDRAIAALNKYASHGLNVYRNSSGIDYPGGSSTRVWNPAYIDYFLAHSPYYIIIDRNHIYPPAGTADWVKIRNQIYSDVLPRYGNNPRVGIEMTNEYYGLDVNTRFQDLEEEIRSDGYTNILGNNNHPHGGTQPWVNYDNLDPLRRTFQGMHFYFNQTTVSGAEWNINGPGQAISKGITSFCCTEVGANANETESLWTASQVSSLNQWLTWAKTMNVGTCIWMDRDVNHLAKYEAMGLQIPFYVNPNTFLLTLDSNPIEVNWMVNGVQYAGDNQIIVKENDQVTLSTPGMVNL